MRKVLTTCFALLSAPLLAQTRPATPQVPVEYAPPVAMPADRVADSYAIYAQLLPGNVIEWGDVQRSQWLIENVTMAEPLGTPCGSAGSMNPHTSVQPPQARQAEFAELLANFDAHCHDRYQLDSKGFHLKLPVKMLDEAARKRFAQGVMYYLPPSNDIMRAPATPEEFKEAAGMHSFTAVYFNRAHTLALTEISMYCGGLCGMSSWAVLERTPTGWRTLPWVYEYVVP